MTRCGGPLAQAHPATAPYRHRRRSLPSPHGGSEASAAGVAKSRVTITIVAVTDVTKCPNS